MTGSDLRAWRKRLGLSGREAAIKLGLGQSTLELYERGERYDRAHPVVIPETVALACAAIEAGEVVVSHTEMTKTVTDAVRRARHMRVDGADYATIAAELGISDLTARRYGSGVPTPTDHPPRNLRKTWSSRALLPQRPDEMRRG